MNIQQLCKFICMSLFSSKCVDLLEKQFKNLREGVVQLLYVHTGIITNNKKDFFRET
jgi:hypothetical protein